MAFSILLEPLPRIYHQEINMVFLPSISILIQVLRTVDSTMMGHTVTFTSGLTHHFCHPTPTLYSTDQQIYTTGNVRPNMVALPPPEGKNFYRCNSTSESQVRPERWEKVNSTALKFVKDLLAHFKIHYREIFKKGQSKESSEHPPQGGVELDWYTQKPAHFVGMSQIMFFNAVMSPWQPLL